MIALASATFVRALNLTGIHTLLHMIHKVTLPEKKKIMTRYIDLLRRYAREKVADQFHAIW